MTLGGDWRSAYFHCDNCQEAVDFRQLTDVSDEQWCENCTQAKAIYCLGCGWYYDPKDEISSETSLGDRCEECMIGYCEDFLGGEG